MGMADRLVPGVTTVTLNARYYSLHGLVAAEAKKRGLDLVAAKDLMRRAEVALVPCPPGIAVAPVRHTGFPGLTATT